MSSCAACVDKKIDHCDENKYDTTSVIDGRCPAGGKCKIFVLARDYYHVSFSVLKHLREVSHPFVKCRYGVKCYSHVRLLKGGIDLKDIVHHAVFFHSRAAVASERVFELETGIRHIGKFILGKYESICPKKFKDLQENMLMEIKRNGYERCLTKPDGGSLVDVARGKMKDPFFKKNRTTVAHILSLLIYTGTDMQGDIRLYLRSITDGDNINKKWYFTASVICQAIYHLREQPPKILFHGLNGVTAKDKQLIWYDNFISFSESNEVATIFAKGQGGTVKHKDKMELGTVLILDTTRLRLWNKSLINGSIFFANMQRISKFVAEREWLCFPDPFFTWQLEKIKGVGNINRMVMTAVEFDKIFDTEEMSTWNNINSLFSRLLGKDDDL